MKKYICQKKKHLSRFFLNRSKNRFAFTTINLFAMNFIDIFQKTISFSSLLLWLEPFTYEQ